MSPVLDSATRAMPASHRSAVEDVDRPVRVTYCPEPRYPPALARYGFTGYVILAFVVAASGVAEMEDLVVLEASHQGFVQSARQAVGKCRYLPAEKAGRPVRFLVQQRVSYRPRTESDREPSRGH